MNVKAVFGQDHVVAAFFSKRASQANVEFVGFAESCAGVCVVAQGVARFDALNEGSEDGIQMGDVGYVEEFAPCLVHHFADVHEAGNHAGGEKGLRRVVAGDLQVIEDGVGGDGFGNDVARALAASIGADIVADENDDAAAFGRRLKEILGGQEDPVVDVGGASGVERIDLFGDFSFVFREGHAQLRFGGKREERDLVIRFKRGKGGVGGVTQGAEERTNRIAQIQNQSDFQGQFVSAEDFQLLL